MEPELLPHDLEVEQARLGAAMSDPTGEAARTLDARWFFDRRHDKLARRMRTLVEFGKIPDLLLLRPIVEEEGWFQNAGGFQYLIECGRKCPSVVNVPTWDRILLEKFRARQAIKLCATVEQSAKQHPEDFGETLRLLREGLKDLEHREQASPEAVPVIDLQRISPGDQSELLRDRYLCRKGGLSITGPTGVGKSSFSMQAMFCWAMGQSFFGIEPARPLKSLLIQAENDDGDLAEIKDGVLRGTGLTDDAHERLKSMVLSFQETRQTGAAFCQEVLRPLLEKHRPDLVWIDPVLAYLGGDTNSQEDVGAFLRNDLNSLLDEFNCAAVLIHHTNKPKSGREKPDWKAGDFAYTGSGSAEWANWPRATLSIVSEGSHSEFRLEAGKRGGRLKWVDSNGQRTWQRNIQHAQDGSIRWELSPEVDPAITPKGRPKKADENDILALLPPDGLTTKDWRAKADEELGMSKTSFFRFKPILEAQGRVHHSKVTDKWQPVATRNGSGSTSPKSSPKSIMAQVVPKVPPPLGVGLFGTVSKAESNNGA